MTLGLLRVAKRSASSPGYTEVLSMDQEPGIGMTLGIWNLAPDQAVTAGSSESETAVLAFSGTGTLSSSATALRFSRPEWIETSPTVIHCCAGESVQARNDGDTAAELIVVQTRNPRSFATRHYSPEDVQIEHRGTGILQETCHRLVRLVFDDSNGPPESNLVLGEVVNFGGRWSSYPPHSHPQPEIYYYRFDPHNGYGYGELGEDVFKIRTGDLLAITGGKTHCQVSAPGYNMYYLWAVRHLERNRYKGFTFVPEHAWTLSQKTT
jgi:5-deoxy-glucuronate isomerase